MHTERIKDPLALAALEDELEEVVAGSAVENIFYEPWFLIPSLRFLSQPRTEVLLFREAARGRIVGYIPLQKMVWGYRAWRHSFCFLTDPFYLHGASQHFWMTLADQGRPLCSFDYLCDNERYPLPPILRLDRGGYNRPTISRKWEDIEGFLAETMKQSRRKDLRRKERMLAKEIGETSLQEASPALLDGLLEKFLLVEQEGWKGKKGTAMNLHQGERSFFKEVCLQAAQRGKLLLHYLGSPDKPIAIRIAFAGKQEIFSFKITFDEAYQRCSPGLLLEVKFLEWFFNQRTFSLIDSCAIPSSALFYRLYPERRFVGTYLFRGHDIASRTLFAGASLVYRTVKALRHSKP